MYGREDREVVREERGGCMVWTSWGCWMGSGEDDANGGTEILSTVQGGRTVCSADKTWKWNRYRGTGKFNLVVIVTRGL